ERDLETGGGEDERIAADSRPIIQVGPPGSPLRIVANNQRSVMNRIGCMPLDQLEELGVRLIVKAGESPHVGRVGHGLRPLGAETVAGAVKTLPRLCEWQAEEFGGFGY